MSSTSEVGISPVLLQAITQTLSTNSPATNNSNGGTSTTTQEVIMSCDSNQPSTSKGQVTATHILHGMNEPVAHLSQPGGEMIVVVQNTDDDVLEEEVTVQKKEQVIDKGDEIVIPHQLIMKGTVGQGAENGSDQGGGASGDISMGNVLSAIASHFKMNRKRSLTYESDSNNETVGEVQQPIIVSITGPTMVPSPANDIMVSEVETDVTEAIIQSAGCSPSSAKKREVIFSNAMQNGTTTYITNSEGIVEGTIVQGDEGSTITLAEVSLMPREVCPICTDRISGYHYGIYSCESCKGFFKRTVQNKKAFLCLRKGDCDITIATRKKCPACRFQRCLNAGMRLEAIREDRTRGGRSSYDGCSPHGRNGGPKIDTCSQKLSNSIVAIQDGTVVRQDTCTESPTVKHTSRVRTAVMRYTNNDSSQSESSDQPDPTSQIQPHTPQLLEDLMAVESLMTDEEEEQSCCEGKLCDGDTDLFGSLLHFADHCLYKIVRWARNLPDFSVISTDDQILLLQNSWAELLSLCSAWNSIHVENALRLSHGRVLDVEVAKAMGVVESVQRVLDLVQQLQRLAVDSYEFVCLKVLVLMTPDVKGLKDESIVRQYQEKVIEALMLYTSTHYIQRPNKFCEMIARLPELSRTCIVAKDLLSARQAAGEVPAYSLLSELLKGDLLVQSS